MPFTLFSVVDGNQRRLLVIYAGDTLELTITSVRKLSLTLSSGVKILRLYRLVLILDEYEYSFHYLIHTNETTFLSSILSLSLSS